MLDSHLIAKTNPVALPENVVFWRDYRVTVLQNRLFRIEKNESKKFRDGATQCVWFRNFAKQSFTVTETETQLRIQTRRCTLLLREKREECRILMGGKEIPIDNAGNLLGTYRTLDTCDGSTAYLGIHSGDMTPTEIELETGVCSKTGVALFHDENSLTLRENGEVCAEKGEGTDEYVFAYGKRYREAVQALYLITGKTPLIPRYALGNWWSRYHAYTDREYLALLNEFERHDVPLTVATIDMDWHYSDHIEEELHITEQGRNTPFYGGNWGWTGYTWNPNYFPDYKEFLRKVAEKDLKITLNLHPADGIRWWEACYDEMATAMGKDPETGERVAFDIANPSFVNKYFSIIHKPYEEDGVTFWWIDWQQGTKSGIEGLDPLWALNHYHTLDHAKNHECPLLLSRYSGVGAHRYPLGFSGDTFVTWKTLRYLPYFTATSSNVGYTWWSHDIGGHMCGAQENELYLRHVQYGVFSPINRLHSSPEISKEPWIYGNGAGTIVSDWLRLRHSMIPFLYSCNYRTHQEGVALVEPLYYRWASSKRAYEFKNEYLFGEQLLVAPVTDPVKADGYARVKTWIPEGKWTDIFTGDTYYAPKGGCVKTLYRHLESIPVLASAGAILPLSLDKGNSVKNPTKLSVNCYLGAGKFTLFEDGKEEGKKGEHVTAFRATYEETDGMGVQTLLLAPHGDSAILPAERTWLVRFPELSEGKATLFIDGKQMEAKEITAFDLQYEIPFIAEKEVRLQITFPLLNRAEQLKARAMKLLDSFEDVYNIRNGVRNALKKCTTVEEFISLINSCNLKKANKLRLLETV